MQVCGAVEKLHFQGMQALVPATKHTAAGRESLMRQRLLAEGLLPALSHCQPPYLNSNRQRLLAEGPPACPPVATVSARPAWMQGSSIPPELLDKARAFSPRPASK